MVNQLAKFTPQLSEATKPLQELLSLNNQWLWSDSQQQAFKAVRNMVSSDAILALFDSHRPTQVSADASLCGLGAILTQQPPQGRSQEFQKGVFINGRVSIKQVSVGVQLQMLTNHTRVNFEFNTFLPNKSI